MISLKYFSLAALIAGIVFTAVLIAACYFLYRILKETVKTKTIMQSMMEGIKEQNQELKHYLQRAEAAWRLAVDAHLRLDENLGQNKTILYVNKSKRKKDKQ